MQTERKEEEVPNIKRDNWSIKQVAKEAVNKPTDETLRQILRGNESKGDADERDIVGGVESIDTPQGREETKKDKGSDS